MALWRKKKNWSGWVIRNIIIEIPFRGYLYSRPCAKKDRVRKCTRSFFVTLFQEIHIMVVNQGKASGDALCGAYPAIFARTYHAEKREIMMYRNNFRPPQMGQSRPNMSFGKGCGMQRSYPQPGNNCCEPCCIPPKDDCCEPPCCIPPKDDCCEPPCCIPPKDDCCEPPCCIPPKDDCCEPQPPKDDCNCGSKPDPDCFPSKKDPIAGMALAMAYVPWQDYKNICPEEEAWCKGTIFAQLDLDFMARRCN